MKFTWDDNGEIQTWGVDADGVTLLVPDDFAIYGPAKYHVVNDALVAREDWVEPEQISPTE